MLESLEIGHKTNIFLHDSINEVIHQVQSI